MDWGNVGIILWNVKVILCLFQFLRTALDAPAEIEHLKEWLRYQNFALLVNVEGGQLVTRCVSLNCCECNKLRCRAFLPVVSCDTRRIWKTSESVLVYTHMTKSHIL